MNGTYGSNLRMVLEFFSHRIKRNIDSLFFYVSKERRRSTVNSGV